MSLIQVLLAISGIDASNLCGFAYCDIEMLGDGICQLECNNEECNYDSPLIEASKIYIQVEFFKSDCYEQCLFTGCDPDNLGNDICNPECNNVYCAWDLSDCGVCNSNCTSQKLNNDICDFDCNYSYCAYDNGDCVPLCGVDYCIKEYLLDPTCHPECSNEDCLQLYPNTSCFVECSKGCYRFMQGDNLCHQECNTKNCSYDLGDCDCAPGCNDEVIAEGFCKENDVCDNKECEFKYRFCGHCNSGCFDFMLGDHVCQEQCNVESCEFDYGDCGCASGCSLMFENGEWIRIEENKGNQRCLVPSCFYNLLNDDLFLVRRAILYQIAFNDLNLTNTKEFSSGCSEEKLRYLDEGKEFCSEDHVCLNDEGLWCFGLFQVSQLCLRSNSYKCLICPGVMVMGQCEYLLSSCPIGTVKDSRLSELFSESKVIWCLINPSYYHRSNLQTFYVKSSDPPKAAGNGSESYPFESLYYSFTKIYGIQTKIIISTGIHIYDKHLLAVLPLRKSILEPLNFDFGVTMQELIISGESYQNPSVVYWKGSLSISSTAKKVLIKNIEFRGDMIIRDNCNNTIDACFYCPFYDPLSNLNDNEEEVSDELKTFYLENNCTLYKNDELFKFQGKVSFENVNFINFRQQFKTLIRVEGSLYLKNVKFSKLQPNVLGLVIQVTCQNKCKNENFVMKGCIVEDLNYGYNERVAIESGGFLKISGVHSAEITSNIFQYNFLFSYDNSVNPSYFFIFANLIGTITIEDCLFSVNYINHIFKVDTSSLEYDSYDFDRYDRSKSYSQTHLMMKNVEFNDIFMTGSVLIYEMNKFEHNVEIKNVFFNNFKSIYKQVFKISYEGYNLAYNPGYTEENGKKYWNSLGKTTFDNISIKDSLLNSSFIEVNNVGLVDIFNINVKNISDKPYPRITEEIREKFNFLGKYLKPTFFSLYYSGFTGYCGKTIHATRNYNLTVLNISVEDWSCFFGSYVNQGVHVEDTRESLLISNLTGINLRSSTEYGILLTVINTMKEVEISEITLRQSSNYLHSMILFKGLEYINLHEIKISDCKSRYSSSVKIESVFSITMKNIFFSDNISNIGYASCLYMGFLTTGSPNAILKNVHFSKCLGESQTPSFLLEGILHATVQLNLSSLRFIECESAKSSIFQISSRLDTDQNKSSIEDLEIINSKSNSFGMLEINSQGTLKIVKLLMKNNTALFAGILIGGLLSKNIDLFDSIICDSTSENSVINLRAIADPFYMSFKNLRIFNIRSSVSSSSVFDITKSFINGNFLMVSDVGGLLAADNNSSFNIFDGEFYRMSETAIVLSGMSKFFCESCIFSENYNKLIKSSTQSSINIQSSLIYNNYFDRLEHSFIELSSENFSSVNVINDTSIFDNIITNGKLLTIQTSFLNIQYTSIYNNDISFPGSSGFEVINSEVKITNSSFSNQTSQNLAPFINCYSNSLIEISYSQFIFGFSLNSGGSIYLSSSIISIYSSQFIQNSALISGGVLYALHSNISIYTTKFSSNSAKNATSFHLQSCQLSLHSVTLNDFHNSSTLNEIIYSALIIKSSVNIDSSLFTQSVIGSSLIHFEDCSSILVISSIFSNIHSYLFGPLAFIGISTYGSLFLKNSSFINNYCEEFGGAVFVKNGNLDIENCSFENNSARNGGAVFYETPDCSICRISLRNKSLLMGNKAVEDGGGIKWMDSKPFIEDFNNFLNNSAKYGNDLASRPAYLGISDYGKLQEGGFDFKLNNLAPGQSFKGIISINILDTYNQVLLSDNQSILKLESNASSLISLSGNTTFQSVSGTFNITGFIIRGPPNSEQSFRLLCNTIKTTGAENDERKYKQDLIFKVFLRGCINGEQIGTDSCKICEENKFLIQPEAKCKICPEGGTCPGGDKINVKPGYYRSHYLSEIVYRCDLVQACLGNPNDYETLCDTGHTGIKCAVCLRGYSKNSDNRCSKCPDSHSNIVALFFMIIFGFVFCMILVRITIKSAFYPASKQSIYVKILMNYLHFIYMISQFNFNWPLYTKKFFQFYESSSFVAESFISIDCYVSNSETTKIYYFKLIFVSLLPLFIFVVSGIVWLGISFFHETYKYLKRELFLTVIVVYFLVFPTIVKTIFSSFDCTKFDIIGEYLSVDYSIKCSTQRHNKYLMIISLPSIILWIFSFPLIILILMIKNRKKFREDKNKVIFGLMFNGYNQSVFYWEFIIMYRKVLIICMVVFLKRVSISVQANTLIILLFFALWLQNKLNPYDSKQLNKIEKVSLISVTFTSFSGLYFLTNDLNGELEVVCFTFMILANLRFFYNWFLLFSESFTQISSKILPFMTFFKKGDSFEEEFFTEPVNVQGFFPGKIKSRTIYTFLEKNEGDKKHFDYNSLFDVYKSTFLDEFEEYEELNCEKSKNHVNCDDDFDD